MGIVDMVLKCSPTEVILQEFSKQDPKFYAKLEYLQNKYQLNTLIPNQYSIAFLLDLHYLQERTGHIESVINEIKSLESDISVSITKPATQFKRKPLIGLWHKHYYDSSPSFLSKNIDNGIKRYGIPYFNKRIEESKLKGVVEYMQPEDIPFIVNDILHENMIKRRVEQQMTGEWIIFSKVKNINYYLCLARHDDGDEEIDHKINPIRQIYPHFFYSI